MGYEMDQAAVARLGEFFAKIGLSLRDKRKRASFAMYACGILGEGERKSAEPIAARACADPELARATHEKLLHFLGRSEWDDRMVRHVSARHVIDAMVARGEPVTTWVIDDTGFLKQGSHSVGVQRQYTGSAGKIANCQIGVSLSVATRTEHQPIDFELYLPECWTEDSQRRSEARIPDAVRFKTKTDLALDMITRAVEAKIPGDIVLADSAYGDSNDFRETVRMFGLDYAVGIHAPTKVWCLDSAGRRRGDAIGVQQLGVRLGHGAFRRTTWRHGTGGKLSSRFCLRRVKVAHDDGTDPIEREPVWLLMEWPDGEERPTKFVLTTLPRRMRRKALVRIVKERWRTERVYEELKGELGLDHFEGRSFPGWHHHVSVVLCCYAFVVAERVRHFPPSQGRQAPSREIDVAA